MSSLIGALRVTLGLDSAAFEKGASAAEKRMAKMERSIEGFGKKLSGVGKTLSVAVTAPMVAFGIASVKAATESRDAMAQVEASLKSMGGAAGRTKDQLGDLATGIMRKSLYDDDEILRKVTANLLTFGAVQGKVFDRAQGVIVDYAAKSGKDLQGSTIMIAKSLQDPIKGLAALGKVGVQFTDQQKKLIKGFVETGQTARAQGVILDELGRQTAGSAAAALAAAGPLAQLKKRFDEISETVGAVLLTALERITPYITRIADGFMNLSPGMQTTIVAAAAIAAALGPVLIVLGSLIGLFAPLLAGLASINAAILAVEGLTFAGYIGGWAAALGSLLTSLLPIAAAVGAIYLVWKNWDDIGPRLTPIIGNLRDIGEALGLIGPRAQEAGKATDDYATDLADLATAAINTSNTFQSWADAFDAYNARTAASARENGTTIQAGLRQIADAFVGLTDRANALGRDMISVFTKAVGSAANLYYGVKNWIGDKLGAVLDGVKAKVDQVGDWFHDMYMRVVGNSDVPDMVREIGIEMSKLDALMVAPARKAAKATADVMRALAGEVRSIMDEVFPDAARLREYQVKLGKVDAGEAAKLVDRDMAAALRNGVLRGLSDADRGPLGLATEDPGSLVDQAGMTEDAARRVIDAMAGMKDRAKIATVAVAKSFKDMADETIQSLSNLANAIKGGGFLGILQAVVGLGLQLGSIGAFGKTIAGRINSPKIPGNALGTSNWRGGLSWVGERGPELVDLPRGSRVYPNGRGPAGGDSYVFQGNLMTPEFWAMIHSGDERASLAGAGLAQSRIATSRQWSLAG